MNTSAGSSTIKLNLPSGILQNAKQEADKIGISLQDFIRMIMGNYFASSKPVYTSVSRDSILLAEAKKEIANGEYDVINNAQDLDKYLETLKK